MNVNDLNAAEKEQYKEVASELRCLVCQNQSLADSHASLAVDLKDKIARQRREHFASHFEPLLAASSFRPHVWTRIPVGCREPRRSAGYRDFRNVNLFRSSMYN